MAAPLHDLRHLAHCHGVQASYAEVRGQRRAASPAMLLGRLTALGASAGTPTGVCGALHRQNAAFWHSVCEPVCVRWEGQGAPLEIRLPNSNGAWAHDELARSP